MAEAVGVKGQVVGKEVRPWPWEGLDTLGRDVLTF